MVARLMKSEMFGLKQVWLPSYGSTVFTRGETQGGFVTTSLGVLEQSQRIEQANFSGEQHWAKHVPPFSTDEVREWVVQKI